MHGGQEQNLQLIHTHNSIRYDCHRAEQLTNVLCRV